MLNEFFLDDCVFTDWDEYDIIEELKKINPQISVAVAMFFFGISQLESKLTLTIHDDDIHEVVSIFDIYCSSYRFSIGRDENEIFFEK